MNNIDILEEKEKEAIKDLEEYLHWEELQGFSMLPRDKHIETLLNLVSNLIAENKELKDSNVELATTIDCLQTDLKEINEEYNAEQKHEMENTIPKSKVKEEIKEVDIQLQKLKDELTGRKTNFVNKNMLFAKKEALQSLLGKE